MSFEGWGDRQFGGQTANEDRNSYNYGNFGDNFGQEQSFQMFDYNTSQYNQANQVDYFTEQSNQPQYFMPGPSLMTPGAPPPTYENGQTAIDEDEVPLLEELGIDPDAIVQKTLTVLNPLRHTDPSSLQDTDLAGPLAFCLAFGSFLLLSGKVHFGYIYGLGLLGCVGLYALLNLMSLEGVGLGVVVSVLGYCLLPMVALAGVNVIFSLQGIVGTILTTAAIIWCSWSASKLFVTALSMHHQQPLVAYPCALFYAVFALITIF